MFWRVPSYSQASPLEGILDKQEFTLEELLDEEDLIQVVPILNLFSQTWVLGMSSRWFQLLYALDNFSEQGCLRFSCAYHYFHKLLQAIFV